MENEVVVTTEELEAVIVPEDWEQATPVEDEPTPENEQKPEDTPPADAEPSDESAEEAPPKEGVEEPKEETFVIKSPYLKDKEEYTESEIVDAIRGQMRQKDYSEKTAELSEIRRGLESGLGLIDALKKADIQESLVETLEDAGFEDAKKLVDQAFSADPGAHPDNEVVSNLETENASLRGQIALIEAKQALMDKFHIKPKTADAVYDAALDHYRETGNWRSLEDQYMIDNYGKNSVRRKQAQPPSQPPVSKGGVKPEPGKVIPGKDDDATDYIAQNVLIPD